MSFRRGRETELAWRRWVNAHAEELIAISIPREVWADRLTWWRFVEHSYHPPIENAREVRFRVEDLSEEQQLRLYQFLDAVLPEARYSYTLWVILHSRFGAPTVNDD